MGKPPTVCGTSSLYRSTPVMPIRALSECSALVGNCYPPACLSLEIADFRGGERAEPVIFRAIDFEKGTLLKSAWIVKRPRISWRAWEFVKERPLMRSRSLVFSLVGWGMVLVACSLWESSRSIPPLPCLQGSEPLFHRYEGSGFQNGCQGDEDCIVSGCSREVCAAESVMTTCGAIPTPRDLGCSACRCVQGECRWTR